MAKQKNKKEQVQSGLQWNAVTRQRTGEWDGLNNAAIYTFNSDVINSLVREMFQNSLDARNKNLKDAESGKLLPLWIRIRYEELTQSDFPDFKGFCSIFEKITTAKPNAQHEAFFRNGSEALNQKKIPFLIFEDYNTVGLEGKDDEPDKSFNSCVISEGVSVKTEATAGGSFGIGKNAIYGLSKLRTVFYVSCNPAGEYIFQGKAKLACYHDGKETKDNKIYCGIGNDAASLRNRNKLPKQLRGFFDRTEPGLSVFAVCPVLDGNWSEEFLKAILRNYWLALDKGDLQVELHDQGEVQKLNKDNLQEQLKRFFDPEVWTGEDIAPAGNPAEFYRTYKEVVAEGTEINRLGKVRFFYRELENRYTNCVAYLRNGMVVYSAKIHGFGSYSYCGVFLCDDAGGNEILRAMEPPRHDGFIPELLTDKRSDLNVNDGRQILREIKNFIVGHLDTIRQKYTTATEEIPWLNDLLASLAGGASGGSGAKTNESSETETTLRMGQALSRTLNFRSEHSNTISVHNTDGETEGTGQHQLEAGDQPRSDGSRKNQGDLNGPNRTRNTNIRSRIFLTAGQKIHEGKTYKAYRVILSSSEPNGTTNIVLSQQGDSGKVCLFTLLEAGTGSSSFRVSTETDKKGHTFGFKIHDVPVNGSFDVYVHEAYKSSFILNSQNHV